MSGRRTTPPAPGCLTVTLPRRLSAALLVHCGASRERPADVVADALALHLDELGEKFDISPAAFAGATRLPDPPPGVGRVEAGAPPDPVYARQSPARSDRAAQSAATAAIGTGHNAPAPQPGRRGGERRDRSTAQLAPQAGQPPAAQNCVRTAAGGAGACLMPGATEAPPPSDPAQLDMLTLLRRLS